MHGMKTLGLIGGLSWYSTSVYYRLINEEIARRLGPDHSASLILHSIDFNDFRVLQAKNDWPAIEDRLVEIAKRLENAGAEVLVMCTNTPHVVADGVRGKIVIPLLHIAEETAKAIATQGMDRVGMLGTRFTMEHHYFISKLDEHGIDTLVPDEEDRELIHRCIFEELTKGIFLEPTRIRFLGIMRGLTERGAQGVIFGCTEIALLIDPESCGFKVFDTTRIHAHAAVGAALSG